jgi:hypothetical protein
MISQTDQELMEKLKEDALANQQLDAEVPITPAGPSDADRLYEAQTAGNKQEYMSQLLRSFQNMLQSSAPNSGYRADHGVSDSMSKQAGQMASNVKDQLNMEAMSRKEAQNQEQTALKNKMEMENHERAQQEGALRQDDFQLKLAKAKLDFQDMEANRDPASPQSKIAQDRVLEVRAKIGQPLNEESVRQQSGEALFKTFDFLKEDLVQYYKNFNAEAERTKDIEIANKRLQVETERNKKLDVMEERRQKRQDLAETEATRRARQNEINTARGFMKDDPRFKKAMEQSMEFDNVGQLIDEAQKGNQQAVGALGTKLARAMGEVGVLTESDVTRYVAGQSWGRKLKDWFKKGAQGELSPETIQGIQANLTTLKEKLGKDISTVYDASTSRMKAAYPDMDETAIRGILGDPRTMKPVTSLDRSSGPYGDTTVRDGKTYKWNPTGNGGKGSYQLIGQ